MKDTIIQENGFDLLDTEDGKFGTGLTLPENLVMAYPTLPTRTPALSENEIKNIITSTSYEFGREWFKNGAQWSDWFNQNGYGSCAGYAGAYASSKAIQLGGQPQQILSGDYLYSLVNGGRDRGSGLNENMQAITSKGIALKSTVGLGGIYRNKYNTTTADREALRFRGHELYSTPDKQTVATALALRMPVVIAIHVTRNWRQFNSKNILASGTGVGNHCEHLDDIKWDNELGDFLFHKCSSHGKSYGDNGACWITWDQHLATPSRYHMFYALTSMVKDPQINHPVIGDGKNQPPPKPEPLITPTIEVVSSSGCHWCVKWAASEKPKLEQKGYKIVSGNSRDIPGNGVPRFRLRVGGKTKDQVGFWKVQDIEIATANMQ